MLSHSGTDPDRVDALILAAVRAAVEDRCREDLEIRYAGCLPTPRVASYVRRCLDEFNPDVVLLHCVSWAVAVQSLEMRVRHSLGGRATPTYERVHTALRQFLCVGDRDAAGRPSAVGTELYRAMRDSLLRLGLGRSEQSAAAAAVAYDRVLQVLASRENLVVLVRGPGFSSSHRRLRRLHRKALPDAEMHYGTMLPSSRAGAPGGFTPVYQPDAA